MEISKIYNLVKRIPKGKITTYNIVAKKTKISPRRVGQILKNNPYKNVPCHRVVLSSAHIGGYKGKHYSKKIKILEKEGVKIKRNRIQDFEEILFRF